MILETAVMCLAINIYHEARGEPLLGQHAVAQVTMNRADWQQKNVCNVVLKPKQFSWTNGKLVDRSRGKARLTKAGKPHNERAWYLARGVAITTLQGRIPAFLGGADHYHTTAVKPSWRTALTPVDLIGRHIFYTSKVSHP